MLLQRVLVTLVLLPAGLYLIGLGGIPFFILILVFLGLAVWEFAALFRAAGFRPAAWLMVAGVAAILAGRQVNAASGAGADPFAWDSLILAAAGLLAMTVHLVDYERGARFSGTDFAVTVSGILYLGLIGGYLLPLRGLPDGYWWFLVVLPATWFADSGAYFIGRAIGRNQFSPRLSPKKTWEGYIGGVLMGTAGGAVMPLILQSFSAVPIAPTPADGAVIGFVIAVVTPLGDLGQSMFKRQVGIKDSSNLLPGHGGIFDRIDSWIWAGVIGYYFVSWLAGVTLKFWLLPVIATRPLPTSRPAEASAEL